MPKQFYFHPPEEFRPPDGITNIMELFFASLLVVIGLLTNIIMEIPDDCRTRSHMIGMGTFDIGAQTKNMCPVSYPAHHVHY